MRISRENSDLSYAFLGKAKSQKEDEKNYAAFHDFKETKLVNNLPNLQMHKKIMYICRRDST